MVILQKRLKQCKQIFIYTAIVLLLLLFCFAFHQNHKYNVITYAELKQVRATLGTFTPEERTDLNNFFEWACSGDTYSYTLLGRKPMSISFIQEQKRRKKPYADKSSEKSASCARGGELWLKHFNQFPSQKYKFVPFKIKSRQFLALMNLSLCQTTIEQNISEFRALFGESLSSSDILLILQNPADTHFKEFMNHDEILGILLGFGKQNSILYETQNEELDFFYTGSWWPEWPLPYFKCDPTLDETKELKKIYCEDRKKIHWTYFGRNVLEVTVALLSK